MTHAMLDHLGIPVASLEVSAAFYGAVLGSLGYGVVKQREHSVGFGVGKKPEFSVFVAADDGSGCGGAHIAFAAVDREAVDRFYTAALAAGATCNGAPGLRPEYHLNYYGAFVLDPDGNNIEAVCHSSV